MRSVSFTGAATTEIYTLSLHDALPIYDGPGDRCPAGETDPAAAAAVPGRRQGRCRDGAPGVDRKSTRLNSSHGYISYAVFCLKKKSLVDERVDHVGFLHHAHDVAAHEE